MITSSRGTLKEKIIGQMSCTCVYHPVYGVEIDHSCPLHGDFCDHAVSIDDYCAQCDRAENPYDYGTCSVCRRPQIGKRHEHPCE